MRTVIDIDARRVANYLKAILNKYYGFDACNVGAMPSMLDVNEAIRILEKQKPKTISIIDDPEDENE